MSRSTKTVLQEDKAISDSLCSGEPLPYDEPWDSADWQHGGARGLDFCLEYRQEERLTAILSRAPVGEISLLLHQLVGGTRVGDAAEQIRIATNQCIFVLSFRGWPWSLVVTRPNATAASWARVWHWARYLQAQTGTSSLAVSGEDGVYVTPSGGLEEVRYQSSLSSWLGRKEGFVPPFWTGTEEGKLYFRLAGVPRELVERLDVIEGDETLLGPLSRYAILSEEVS